MNKMLETGAKVLAGVGALNWGLVEFLNFNVLSFVPTGIVTTGVIGLIAVSGGYLLYNIFQNKI